MNWAKRYRRHDTHRKRILKKRERLDKMSKIKTPKEKTIQSKDISPENYFVLQNGETLKSIEQLAIKVEDFEDTLFAFHVNQDKNDFANWIRHVFDEPALADDLLRTTEKHQCHVFLLKHLAFK
ncbi:hypothetical protein ACFL0V_00240 [Nanoarchaeota archaeon]